MTKHVKKMKLLICHFQMIQFLLQYLNPTARTRYLFKLVNTKTNFRKEKFEWNRVIDRFNMICSYAIQKVRLLIDTGV